MATANTMPAIANKETCTQMTGLVKRQQVICKRNLEVMGAVMEGARLAISECQHQFQNRRWNCSTINHISMFGDVLNQGRSL